MLPSQRGGCTAVLGVGTVGRGGLVAPLEESPSCSVLWLSKHTEFTLFFFSPSACPARNSLLIVYTGSAATAQQSAGLLLLPTLLSLSLLCPMFPPSALVLYNFLLFSSAAEGWPGARRQPRQGSAAQTALCHFCAKVTLGGHIVFYE